MLWSRRILVLTSISALALAVFLLAAPARPTRAQVTIESPYDASYAAVELGSVPGVPSSYGGLTFLADDPNTILIGGEANDPTGALYSIEVMRDGSNHITGFSGSADQFADAAYNDGGVAYGPGGVLFLARWPENEVGETKPGSSMTDKVVALSPLGVTESVSALNFIPAGFPGAGSLKLAVYDDGNWYDAGYSADGSGTFNITSATLETSLGDVGPEGFTFVPPGSPVFAPNSILLAEYDSDEVTTYELDGNGDPIVSSREVVVSGLVGAEGAAIDPVTGDFLFSTFGGEDQVVAVRGFAEPGATPTAEPTSSPTTTPEPTATPTATEGATPTPTTTQTPEPTATPAPSETPGVKVLQGDLDCDGDVDSVDALKDLRHVAALPVQQNEPCTDIGMALARVESAGLLTSMGDVDCDEDVDSVDALKILRHVAALPVQQMEPCRDIGA